MWDWERASVPYRPIYQRRLVRRRVLTLLIAALVAIPYYLYQHQRATEPMGQRVYDQVVSTISVRYFDRGYHGVAWHELAKQYRPRIVDAPSTQARYAALRELIANLHDSHTAVYSPYDLQPPRDKSDHEVLGMSPDAWANAPSVDWRTLKPGIGYLRIASFPDAMTDVLAWAMSDVGRDRALILDLRGNPGGLVDSVDEVAGVFLPPGTLVSSGTRRYSVFGPQQFRATDAAGVAYGGRLVVLVDRNSRSGAESLARALQYYRRATLVGTRTAGKVLGVDAEIPLDDGGLLRVATLDMRDPSGQRLEGRGVMPDLALPQADILSRAITLVADTTGAASASTSQNGCPVEISSFSDDATGKPNGYEQYSIQLTPPNGSYSATLAVWNVDSEEGHFVLVPIVSSTSKNFVFRWPKRELYSIAVLQTIDLSSRKVMACDATHARGLDPPKPFQEVVKRCPVSLDDAHGQFDDTNVKFEGDVSALLVHDADFRYKAMLQYPEIAKQDGTQGCAVVDVTIGAGGTLIDAKLLKLSCNQPLNCGLLGEAALRAARSSTYSGPTLDGKPTQQDYLIDYLWQLG